MWLALLLGLLALFAGLAWLVRKPVDIDADEPWRESLEDDAFEPDAFEDDDAFQPDSVDEVDDDYDHDVKPWG